MAESSERHSSVCEKERKRNFQSSAGWNPLALLPTGCSRRCGMHIHTQICVLRSRVCAHTRTHALLYTGALAAHTHTRSHEYVRARP